MHIYYNHYFLQFPWNYGNQHEPAFGEGGSEVAAIVSAAARAAEAARASLSHRIVRQHFSGASGAWNIWNA